MSVSELQVLENTSVSSGFWPKLRSSFAAHGIFIVLMLAYLVAFQASKFFYPDVVDKHPLQVVFGLVTYSLPLMFFLMMLIQFYYVATIDKPESPFKGLIKRMKAVMRHEHTMVRGIPMYLSLLFFMYTFTIVKANISNYVPFAWDSTFDQWDKTLHFGTRPWEWLQPIFGNLFATVVLNVNYNMWFIVMKVFWVYFAFIHAPGLERTRFFLAYMLTWCIGGSLFAIFFSSVGPCFYNYVESGVNPYAELMTQLRAFNEIIPVWAVDTQDMLWQFRIEQSALGGVTAMPSMHNATALLFVLVTWNKSKVLRNILIAHMILVFLGSIHLGWHYAVDAYIAWPITLVCWFAAHKLARWWEQRPAIQDFNPRYTENV